jgi:predicted DsbA family dithiol-disulfide isomerase
MPEYQDRVKLRIRPFPLDLFGSEPAPREILQQEWWLAALQEPAADFKPYVGNDWPKTTLPAFDAVWCAFQQGEAAGFDYDLRVRRAFFAESRNIGRSEVLLEIAREAGLDLPLFTRLFEGSVARLSVLEDFQAGRDRYKIRGTPVVMLADGTRLHLPIAFPVLQDRKIVKVRPLPCCGDACLDATRSMLERAAETGEALAATDPQG